MSALPQTMTAMAITEYGAPEVLQPQTRPVPQPGWPVGLTQQPPQQQRTPNLPSEQDGTEHIQDL